MFDIQSFMLYIHPDVVYTVKGLWFNDGECGGYGTDGDVKSDDGEYGRHLFIDYNFKCIGGNIQLIDSDGTVLEDVYRPQYSKVLKDGDAPYAGLMTTDTLFFSQSKYVEIEFD